MLVSFKFRVKPDSLPQVGPLYCTQARMALFDLINQRADDNLVREMWRLPPNG